MKSFDNFSSSFWNTFPLWIWNSGHRICKWRGKTETQSTSHHLASASWWGWGKGREAGFFFKCSQINQPDRQPLSLCPPHNTGISGQWPLCLCLMKWEVDSWNFGSILSPTMFLCWANPNAYLLQIFYQCNRRCHQACKSNWKLLN